MLLRIKKNKGMMKETDMRHLSDLGNQALCRTTATAHTQKYSRCACKSAGYLLLIPVLPSHPIISIRMVVRGPSLGKPELSKSHANSAQTLSCLFTLSFDPSIQSGFSDC